MWLSTKTNIAERWIRDPFSIPMPVALEMVNVEFKSTSIDETGEVVIDFGEMIYVEDEMPIDKTVLRLSSSPRLEFTWTATLQNGSELLLKLDYAEPMLVSPPDDFDFA